MTEELKDITQDLASNLHQFTGTENWYMHPFNRNMTYTDGVKYFAEVAGAYWFIDIVATEVFPLQKLEPFITLTLTVNDNKAVIEATDGNEHKLWHKPIPFTDCPSGEWKFYFIDHILLLHSEY